MGTLSNLHALTADYDLEPVGAAVKVAFASVESGAQSYNARVSGN